MFKIVLQSAINNLDNHFTYEDLSKAYFKEYLKTFNAEEELETEESDQDGGTATRTKEVCINFGEEEYILINIKGYYNVETEPMTHDYPGSYDEHFDDFEITDIDNNSSLTDEEIVLGEKKDWTESFGEFIDKIQS